MSSKEEKKAKKLLVIILVISTPVIVTREKEVENAENSKNLGITARTGEDNENLRPNIIQVLCI